MRSAKKTEMPERRGNDGRMESAENHKQVSLSFHRPWKSPLRFPHSHRADGLPLSLKTKPQRSSLFPVRLTSVQAHSSMRICCNATVGYRLDAPCGHLS
jgi:hypothetical protein